VQTVDWTVRPPAPPEAVAALSRALAVPPSLAAILWARGLRDEAKDHLDPPLARSPNPALEQAAERLAAAIDRRERIVIHGDYDADGITGTALLLLGLRELGGAVTAFIPNRLTDGYGLNPDRVAELAANADLLVTVDCGITNLPEVASLQAAGVEVIVTDHHTPGESTPDCLVVHPRLSPLARDGLPELTGSGVAFHLLWALRERLGLDAPLDYADLAAIGTIADVAPLLGENRALIKEGLRRMGDSRWPGIAASVKQARLNGKISARDVAFVLAPRLNAAGRLGEADKGLALLTTASVRQARELAAYLDARNADRRKIQDEMLEHAVSKVDEGAPALVLEDPAWHAGVMGIVASKLLERYYKPVFIATAGKGSVRSTPGISAVDGLQAASAFLKRFGGHRQAAGFGLDMTSFEGFRLAIYRFVEGFPAPRRSLVADAVISAAEVENGLYRAIDDLEPFGEGHPAPLFALAGRLERARAVGANRATLQLWVDGVKGVAWQQGHIAASLPVGGGVNVACTIRETEWQQKVSLEILAQAVRPAALLALEPSARGPHSLAAAVLVGRQGVSAGDAGDPGEAPVGQGFTGARPARIDDLGEDPVAGLEGLVATGQPFLLALDQVALGRIEQEALEYPTVHDVRRGLVAMRRGERLPFDEPKSSRVRKALVELGLIDEADRARALPIGYKLSPFDSDSLLEGLVERYRLRNFVHAYRHFDDEAFALSVVNLFGLGSGSALRLAEEAVPRADGGAVTMARDVDPVASG